MINVSFPDGSVREYPDGSTPMAIAQAISKSLAKRMVAAKIDGIIAPVARRDHSAIEIQYTSEFVAFETDLAGLARRNRKRQDCAQADLLPPRLRAALFAAAAASRSSSSCANRFCIVSISHCRISSFCVAGSKRSLHGVP